MTVKAIIIDSREPEWVQKLPFGGVPVTINQLNAGDVMAACDDGETLLIERKTADDYLGSLKDGRLFHQVADMVDQTRWVYVVITDELQRGPNNTVITPRGTTGWSYNAVWGSILSIQELGAFVVFAGGETDFEACVLRICARRRDQVMRLNPVKVGLPLTAQEQIIASLPGIGMERLDAVMDAAGGSPAWAFVLLTDLTSEIPGISRGVKARIRNAMKLEESKQQFGVVGTDLVGENIMAILKQGEQ